MRARLNNFSLDTYIRFIDSVCLTYHDLEVNDRGNIELSWEGGDDYLKIECKPDGNLYWLIRENGKFKSVLASPKDSVATAKKNNVTSIVIGF